MARSKHKKDASKKAPQVDPLETGIRAFDAGDYVVARRLLEAKAEDPDLSDAERQQARDMAGATRLERGAVLVGLACAALFLFAVVFTTFQQP